MLASGPQKCCKGKWPKLVAQLAVELRRPRVAPERLRAVGIVDRRGRADVIGLAADAVHGKPHGRSQGPFHVREQVPNLRPLDAIVRRGPHFDLLLLAPIEPVGHHAMCRRQPAGGHVGLHRAGHAGEAGHEVGDLARRGHLAELRHDGHVFFTQAGDGEEDEGHKKKSEIRMSKSETNSKCQIQRFQTDRGPTKLSWPSAV